MNIERIPEWAMTPADQAQIAILLELCFTTDFGGRSYFQQRHHLRLITRREGRIVGHMALLFRAIRLGGRLTDIVGLADVATDPDFRAQGIAHDLLQAVIAEARATPAEFIMLFGNANIYSGNGFRRFPNSVTYVEMRGARTGAVKTEEAQELMVLPLRDRPWPATAPLDLLGTLF